MKPFQRQKKISGEFELFASQDNKVRATKDHGKKFPSKLATSFNGIIHRQNQLMLCLHLSLPIQGQMFCLHLLLPISGHVKFIWKDTMKTSLNICMHGKFKNGLCPKLIPHHLKWMATSVNKLLTDFIYYSRMVF